MSERFDQTQASTRGPSGRHVGRREWLIIFLLVFGGFLGAVGWIVGAWMLWWSSAWTRVEKLIGTLVVPGGVALAAFLSQKLIEPAGTSSSGPLALATILAAILPLLTAAFLARRARPAQLRSG